MKNWLRMSGRQPIVCECCGCDAHLVASQSLVPLPHASGIVTVEVGVSVPLEFGLGPFNSPPQIILAPHLKSVHFARIRVMI